MSVKHSLLKNVRTRKQTFAIPQLSNHLLRGCDSYQSSIYANKDVTERIIFHLGINCRDAPQCVRIVTAPPIFQA